MRKRDLPKFKELMILADALRDLPRKRFNYAQYVGPNWGGVKDLSCGTPACALGLAATLFRPLSLEMSDSPGLGTIVLRRDGEESYGFSAARRFFRISIAEALELFQPDTVMVEGRGWSGHAPGDSATPKQVARHVRRFVKYKAKQLGVELDAEGNVVS